MITISHSDHNMITNKADYRRCGTKSYLRYHDSLSHSLRYGMNYKNYYFSVREVVAEFNHIGSEQVKLFFIGPIALVTELVFHAFVFIASIVILICVLNAVMTDT